MAGNKGRVAKCNFVESILGGWYPAFSTNFFMEVKDLLTPLSVRKIHYFFQIKNSVFGLGTPQDSNVKRNFWHDWKNHFSQLNIIFKVKEEKTNIWGKKQYIFNSLQFYYSRVFTTKIVWGWSMEGWRMLAHSLKQTFESNRKIHLLKKQKYIFQWVCEDKQRSILEYFELFLIFWYNVLKFLSGVGCLQRLCEDERWKDGGWKHSFSSRHLNET